MKLLGTHASPYVRKVRLVLLEKNIPHSYLIDPPREPGSQVARVKRWEALADGIMDSAVVVRGESLRPAEKQDAGTLTRHNDAVTRALAHTSAQLGQRAWCEGTSITLADLALASALIYLDLRQPDRDWRAAHPDLAAWFSRMNERASVRTSLAE